MSDTLLRVEDIRTYFHTYKGTVKAVDGVSFELQKGKALGIVGESGCGKTVTVLSILRLVQPPGMMEGKVLYKGIDLFSLRSKEMSRIRGKEISLVFQDPLSSLNPVMTIGSQVTEAIRMHYRISNEEARERAIKIMKLVGIPQPEERYHEFPFRLSGGLRQRVAIAMALACNPSILIADEPTTNLDVTIQAQILDLILELKTKLDMSVILISHNLGVVAWVCDYVAVMYAGKVVEYGTVDDVYSKPLHPYTQALIGCVPSRMKPGLETIPGTIPDLINPPTGCMFHPRCRYAFDKCETEIPLLQVGSAPHEVACWLYR